jgi:L-lactate dehydrogenase (cytochrome)/(S)-mandelate dehydrogenase
MNDQWYSIETLRIAARRRLPRMLFDFIDGGAEDERTMRRNVDGFARLSLTPRMLSPAPRRDLWRGVVGDLLELPVMVAPTGLSGLFWPRGELAVARACERLGTVMTVSHASTISFEALAASSPAARWFQIMIYKDRAITEALAEVGRQAGYSVLCLTVDLQGLGQRERDIRNGLTVPPRLTARSVLDLVRHPAWVASRLGAPVVTMANYERFGVKGLATVAAYMERLSDADVGWDDLEWLRARWPGKLVLKGIMHPDDARRAADAGVDGIVVSNHGGRQLDGAPASIEALPRCVAAADGRLEVLLDGGVRRGVDVLKAVALGARAVLIGRPHLWGLAAGGERGVIAALAILRAEMDRAMTLGGWDDLEAVRAAGLE